jgi:hypothetical protein
VRTVVRNACLCVPMLSYSFLKEAAKGWEIRDEASHARYEAINGWAGALVCGGDGFVTFGDDGVTFGDKSR